MCRHRDDAHIAVVVAAALVVGTDGHQARVLAAGACGVGRKVRRRAPGECVRACCVSSGLSAEAVAGGQGGVMRSGILERAEDPGRAGGGAFRQASQGLMYPCILHVAEAATAAGTSCCSHSVTRQLQAIKRRCRRGDPPELGCRLTASKPVMVASCCARSCRATQEGRRQQPL